MRRARVLSLALAGLLACREEPFVAQFAVRGRCPGERGFRYRIDERGGPLSPAQTRAAIERALADWQATGCVRFTAAEAGEEPDVAFAWHAGAHAACVPFGVEPGVAHAGPVAPRTFVHFDAERPFGSELSLHQAALHEIGHVLGLDHGPDERSVMFPVPARGRDTLAPSDLCALRSLYGGPAASPADLVVRRTDGSTAATLYGVAPRALTGWTVFDTDGDGDDEVLVWRTDARGQGALWSFHFAPGPALERTLGPLYGVTASGCEPALVARAGVRLLVLVGEHGPVLVRPFDSRGIPGDALDGPPPLLDEARQAARAHGDLDGDLDGDGRMETIALGP